MLCCNDVEEDGLSGGCSWWCGVLWNARGLEVLGAKGMVAGLGRGTVGSAEYRFCGLRGADGGAGEYFDPVLGAEGGAGE